MPRRSWIFGLAGMLASAGCSAAPAPAVVAQRAEAQPHASHPPHPPIEEHRHDPPPMAAEHSLARIADPGNICMLSNRYLGEKQHVPVEVDGKTYFGCCAGCAGKLGQTPQARVAVDPVSGRSIDKAAAVLARDERGKVVYFESEATFAQARDAR